MPEQGVRLAGNLRKIRWSAKGKGKSGGVRIIYALIKDDSIYLLFIFPKNEQENLTKKQLNLLQKLADQELS